MKILPLTAVFALTKMAYKMILRDLLVNAISDPDQEWDDFVLDILDKIFDYEPPTQ